MEIGRNFLLALSNIKHVVPEIIALVANVADIFLDSTLKLYIVESACSNLYSGKECKNIKYHQEKNEAVQKLAASYLMWNNFVIALPVLVVLPLCGSWSDSTKRKNPIIACSILCAVAAIIMSVHSLTPGEDMYLILVGTVFRAVACRISIIIIVVSSIVTDSTASTDRTKRFSYLLSMRYIGIIVGLTTQGFLLHDNMFPEIFLLDSFLFLIIVFLAVCFLNEKKSEHLKKIETPRGRKMYLLVWQSVKILWHKPGRGTLLQMWIIFLVFMIDRTAKNADYEVSILYMGQKMPYFTNADFSWFRTIETIFCALISTIGVRFLISGDRSGDIHIAILAVALRILRMIIFAFSDNVLMFYVANILGTPTTLMVSTCKSLLSQVVSEEDVGKAFSMATCLEILANMAGSIATLKLYTATSKYFAGTVYIFIAFLYVIVLVLLLVLKRLDTASTSEQQA